MKRLISVLLVLAAVLTLFSGCLLTSKKESGSEPVSSHHLIHTVHDGSTVYYCWEDGVATVTDTYDASSALSWENDVANGAYYIKNSKGTVAMEQYAEKTEAPAETETETETETDPYHGHTLVGIVTDTDSGNTYYCWDDGNATMTEEYKVSGLTWTHPWNEKFFNIYNGISDNGNVVYSEKTCSWCGNHKVYYLSYTRNYHTLSREPLYLCESCHIDLQTHYVICSKCGYYYYKDFAYYAGGKYYCEKCYTP